MIRKLFKQNRPHERYGDLIRKYKIPHAYLSMNRRMVSRAVLVGLFIAFIPMPLQMVAIVLIAPFFRHNVLIAISMVWITNPFTMPFIYYVEYRTGNWLMMAPSALEVELSMEWFRAHIGEIFVPLYVGALFYSSLLSVSAYTLVNWLWIRSVHREKHDR